MGGRCEVGRRREDLTVTVNQEHEGTGGDLRQELRQSFSFLFTTVMGVLATQKALIAAMQSIPGFGDSFSKQIREHEHALEQARLTLLRSLERHLAATPDGNALLAQLKAELTRKTY